MPDDALANRTAAHAGSPLRVKGLDDVVLRVSDMDRAVVFYTEILGLKLTNRFGDHWATVQAGASLTVGLHPASPQYPAPGTKGGMMLGLEINEPKVLWADDGKVGHTLDNYKLTFQIRFAWPSGQRVEFSG